MLEKIMFYLSLIKGKEISSESIGKTDWGMSKTLLITYQLPSGQLVEKIKRI